MKKNLFFFFLLCIPLVSAVECTSLIGQEYCDQISSLSVEDQEYIISGLINPMHTIPDHDFVRQWNLNINTREKPDGIASYDRGYINNAWVKILTIMPSVQENSRLYCTDHGEVLTAYDHTISYPSEPLGNDCRTEFNTVRDDARLKIYANNNHQGTRSLVNFNTDRDTRFKAEYDITLITDVEHYEEERYCCRHSASGRCTRRCTRCVYETTDRETDRLIITDYLNAEYYNPETKASFTIQHKYDSTTQGVLQADEYASVSLDFPQSYFRVYQYWYDLVWSIPPYNVLTVRAVPQQQIQNNNLFFEGANPYTIRVQSNECSLTVSNHLKSFNIPCSADYEAVNISLTTNKNSYEDGETILVHIQPSDRQFNFSYAGTTKQATGTVEFTAKYPYNRIILEHNGRSYDKIIYVGRTKYLYLFFYLVVSVGVLVSLMYVLRKRWSVTA